MSLLPAHHCRCRYHPCITVVTAIAHMSPLSPPSPMCHHCCHRHPHVTVVAAVAHISLLSPPSPICHHCRHCHPHVTITAAITHASPLPLPSPMCRCCHCHYCRHRHLYVNIAEEGPCYCLNTQLCCRKAHCVAQSQHMFQTKKKRKDLLLGPTSGSQGQERRPLLRPT